MPHRDRSGPPRWRLILNGKAAGDEAVREAVAQARARGIELDVRVTWEHGDGARYAAEACAAGVDTLIAAGGDGTLGEVASALLDAAGTTPTRGVLPQGTANDVASAAQLPDAAEAAFALIAREPARTVDVLRVHADGRERWCVNLASGGFGTQVTVQTDEGLKKMLGGLAYLITGIAQLGRIEPCVARIRGPGFEWDGAFIALGLGNGRQAGGGQALCPDALVDDGLIDLTVIPELAGEVGATVATLLTEGREGALDRVAVRARAPWFELRGETPFDLNLDGEPVRASVFRVECRRGRLRMHIPADSPLLRDAAAAAFGRAGAGDADASIDADADRHPAPMHAPDVNAPLMPPF